MGREEEGERKLQSGRERQVNKCKDSCLSQRESCSNAYIKDGWRTEQSRGSVDVVKKE